MIHQYKNNGYNIVLDVNSGSVHVVDDMVYDIIGLYENNTLEQITEENASPLVLKVKAELRGFPELDKTSYMNWKVKQRDNGTI